MTTIPPNVPVPEPDYSAFAPNAYGYITFSNLPETINTLAKTNGEDWLRKQLMSSALLDEWQAKYHHLHVYTELVNPAQPTSSTRVRLVIFPPHLVTRILDEAAWESCKDIDIRTAFTNASPTHKIPKQRTPLPEPARRNLASQFLSSGFIYRPCKERIIPTTLSFSLIDWANPHIIVTHPTANASAAEALIEKYNLTQRANGTRLVLTHADPFVMNNAYEEIKNHNELFTILNGL
ncbi:hypothetical protein HDV00_006047 [Rhizophlyctis rosea]|nr:hypothetical protein HDV00_006047 [Rhizophlyctis rosea]